MVALRGRDIDVFLTSPDPARPIILLYGPDAGLVRERADALLASAVDDPADPFSLVRLDGDELVRRAVAAGRRSDDDPDVRRPPRHSGPRRFAQFCLWRRYAGRLADQGLPHRDRGRRAAPELPLRKACERAKTAVAIGCYPDGERDLAKLIDDEMRRLEFAHRAGRRAPH